MYILLVLAVLVVAVTIGTGIVKYYKNETYDKGQIKKGLLYNLCTFVPIIAIFLAGFMPEIVQAADATSATGNINDGLGYIAASLSTGLACIATGIAVGSVGSSALGSVSEDPKILGRTLIFVGLAEGIAIYGLIISIMILGRI